MFEPTKYELEKAHQKQKLVRNEVKCVGKFGMPLIQKQDIDPYMIRFINFADTKRNDVENAHRTVHFFTYDWLYNKVYDDYENQLDVLKQYKAVLSPEFSIYTDMPIALQIYSTFKNRWCGAYWQKNGITVIPTICWGDERSFDFCFDGIEQGSIVAVSTYYMENLGEDFMQGYDRMLKIINPKAVICYDDPFPSMKGNVISYLPTQYEWTNSLTWQELARFKSEKGMRNIIKL